MKSKTKIGYSFWGFLGNGVVNTPDGGRSHRITFLKELQANNFELYILQKNRDLVESKQDFSKEGFNFISGFPKLDLLFLEYRWEIPGRNIYVNKGSDLYTPDWDRQQELLDHYMKENIPIFVWDKDQKLDDYAKVLNYEKLTIFEPSLKPSNNRKQLLFPIDQKKTQEAKKRLHKYSQIDRNSLLTYVGNQYERDESLIQFFDIPSKILGIKAQIYGKWTDTSQFKNLSFNERIGFEKVDLIYKQSLSTVLIAPVRYYETGQYTQRLFEALWAHCIPLVPSIYNFHELIFPHELIVKDGESVSGKIEFLRAASSKKIIDLLEFIFNHMSIFKPSEQVKTIIEQYERVR